MRTIKDISKDLKTQNNHSTREPMYCVQTLIKDVGYDPAYSTDTVWINMESGDYEEVEPNTPGAEEFGYKERWETQMVCLTEKGAKEHLELNGHNYRYYGPTRIYVESFYRCPEMQLIRKMLMELGENQ